VSDNLTIGQARFVEHMVLGLMRKCCRCEILNRNSKTRQTCVRCEDLLNAKQGFPETWARAATIHALVGPKDTK
jgi:hypothetical protein